MENIHNTGTGEEGGLHGLENIQYSFVDNIILVFHGNSKDGNTWINTAASASGNYESMYANMIHDLLKECSQVRIRNIDFQCCFSARYDSKTKSLEAFMALE